MSTPTNEDDLNWNSDTKDEVSFLECAEEMVKHSKERRLDEPAVSIIIYWPFDTEFPFPCWTKEVSIE